VAGLVRSDFSRPYNPGGLLHHTADITVNGDVGHFDLYDFRDALRTILLNADGSAAKDGLGAEFFMNFAGANDGDDVIFGDLGNDWLAGGSGDDTLWGGLGNDYLNADDDLSTNGGRNDHFDPTTYADRVYGGGGHDILLANALSDRLIDWQEFRNRYHMPDPVHGDHDLYDHISDVDPDGFFKGDPVVWRLLGSDSDIAAFLYELSASQGADPTRSSDTGGDPARNGEPDGEAGVVRFGDPRFIEDTGGNRDANDYLRDAIKRYGDFASDSRSPLDPASGAWMIRNQALWISDSSARGDAIALYYDNPFLPSRFFLDARVQAADAAAGWRSNAYLVFDYYSPTDFKFAGLNVTSGRFEIGFRDTAGWHVAASALPADALQAGDWYSVRLTLDGNQASLSVSGLSVPLAIGHTFAARMVAGTPVALNGGRLGVGSDASRAGFDDVFLSFQEQPVTLDHTENFDDGAANLFTGDRLGQWILSGGRYVTTAQIGTAAISVADLGVSELGLTAMLELSTKIKTSQYAGFVFDRKSASDFKFAAIDIAGSKVVLGHMDATTLIWKIDAFWIVDVLADVEYTFGLTLNGARASVFLNGVRMIELAYAAPLVDGAVGLFSRAGDASFDDFRVRTDDGAFRNAPGSVSAPDAVQPAPTPQPAMDETTLALARDAAIARWALVPGVDPDALAGLATVRFALADLSGDLLADALRDTIYLDLDGAGRGWTVLAGALNAEDVLFEAIGHLLYIRTYEPAVPGPVVDAEPVPAPWSNSDGVAPGPTPVVNIPEVPIVPPAGSGVGTPPINVPPVTKPVAQGVRSLLRTGTSCRGARKLGAKFWGRCPGAVKTKAGKSAKVKRAKAARVKARKQAARKAAAAKQSARR
jgi:hypothetical protein